jgi:hypothetical protein
MDNRPLDPRKVNIALDANALDRDESQKAALVDRFLSLRSSLKVVMSAGVRDEVQHPHTPINVKEAILPQIFNFKPGLNQSQQATRERVRSILQGNAISGKHCADASHISEAAETGCSYFITHDKRILNKRLVLASVLLPSMKIVTLTEFFEIYDEYDAADLQRQQSETC